jgi:heterodisulfide reductase subunit A
MSVGSEINNEGQKTPVLVIGAGISGIEASLLLANAGRKVYLVEKSSYTGGNVIKWEEVYPNMDCATCMVAPKQQDMLANENIELLTLSEVESIQGTPGDYTVKVRKRARYVSLVECIGCSACFDPCPVEVDNDFESGMTKRKAIYIPCAGALPNVPAIDTENCLRFTKGESCELCKEACMFEAIEYDQQDEELELKVGAVVVATGFDTFDLTKVPQYGYRKFENVYSALELERLRATNGPTTGELVLRNGQPPKSAAIIHCVGRAEKGYCSSVCCMYSLKHAHYLQDKVPGVKIYQIYSDLCIPGKSYQRFYEKIKEHGVDFIRGNVLEVSEQGKGLTIKYKTEDGKENTLAVDMLILAPAIEPRADSAEVAKIFNITQGDGGFFDERELEPAPAGAPREGIFIAGCAQGPKDIQESVAEAEATVGKILSLSK